MLQGVLFDMDGLYAMLVCGRMKDFRQVCRIAKGLEATAASEITMLFVPAASVMGSLMYLRASNGVYFEVGGTTTNIGVIKDGRPAIDYSIVGGRRTCISSLDVRILGAAGSSMARADKSGVKDVGPRSAHIAGMDYAVFTPEEEIVDPKVVFFSPKEGDPDDYVAIELASGKRITITKHLRGQRAGAHQAGILRLRQRQRRPRAVR